MTPIKTIKRILRPLKPSLIRFQSAVYYYFENGLSAFQKKNKGENTDDLFILVCDETEPAPDRHAGGARMSEIVKILSQYGRVAFAPLRIHDDSTYRHKLSAAGVELIEFVRLRFALKARRFDLAIISRPEVGNEILHLVRRYSPTTKIIFDTVDIASVRYRREFDLTGNSKSQKAARQHAEQEKRLAMQSDEVWCVTDADKQFILDMAPQTQVRIVPTIHNVRTDPAPPFSERSGIVFVGSSHRPNIDAMHYFCESIMPSLRELKPGIKLSIVGSNLEQSVFDLADNDIEVLGYVPDLNQLLDGHRISICPLRYGSGMKGKIGESLALGLPVVTTSIGAEGMDLNDGRDVLITDDADEFAACVANLYDDEKLWTRLAANGKEYVESHCSASQVAHTIDEAFSDLGLDSARKN